MSNRFNYDIFSGTDNYYWDETYSKIVYWTDGVETLINNNNLILIIEVVDTFINLIKNDQLSVSDEQKEMIKDLSFWTLTKTEQLLNFEVKADSHYDPCFEYQRAVVNELDFSSIKLYCSQYGSVYVLMLNNEY